MSAPPSFSSTATAALSLIGTTVIESPSPEFFLELPGPLLQGRCRVAGPLERRRGALRADCPRPGGAPYLQSGNRGRQRGSGVRAVSNVKPVLGSSDTPLPASAPYPPSWAIVTEPDWPASAGIEAEFKTSTPRAGMLSGCVLSKRARAVREVDLARDQRVLRVLDHEDRDLRRGVVEARHEVGRVVELDVVRVERSEGVPRRGPQVFVGCRCRRSSARPGSRRNR